MADNVEGKLFCTGGFIITGVSVGALAGGLPGVLIGAAGGALWGIIICRNPAINQYFQKLWPQEKIDKQFRENKKLMRQLKGEVQSIYNEAKDVDTDAVVEALLTYANNNGAAIIKTAKAGSFTKSIEHLAGSENHGAFLLSRSRSLS